ncbi:hypothetical protein IFM89_035292 [Coptis chinensis]|uniref:Uncharacterized protein n=1 Tax=Coptis chinensis TaxID=261450 RepID=A0A835IGC7_9MAGN|nr:hypothetical protein IFM89_035292 [Coptis chinensis]
MIITVKEETIVQPVEKTPRQILWTTSIMYKSQAFIYISLMGIQTFFSPNVLRDALSKVLVPFYPFAGKLKWNNEGRLEIDCNGDGALFIEAETESVIEDLGEFLTSEEITQLIPKVDYTKDISSYPVVRIQVTYFKCGGVSLGVVMAHSVGDGDAGLNFICSWSGVARGIGIKIPPFIDRTLLRARDPPTPSFPHIEYQPPPTMQPSQYSNSFTASMFRLSSHHINLLKAQCAEGSDTVRYSSFEVIAAHVWRCACWARGLVECQESKLTIPVDGRSRLSPPFPPGYLGNAIFNVTPMATAGEILSKPFIDIVRKIHEHLVMVDDEYIRSAIDYSAMQPSVFDLIYGANSVNCPNIAITSWYQMPIHEAEFGLGRPIYMGPGAILCEGLAYILPSPVEDGSRLLAIALQPEHMALFKDYIYDI